MDEAVRTGSARPRVVVLEKVGVDVQLIEQRVSDRLVASLGDPGALHVAAAEMDRNRQVLRPSVNDCIDQCRIGMRQLVGVVAPLLCLRPLLRVAEVGEVRVVELNVPAPGGVER